MRRTSARVENKVVELITLGYDYREISSVTGVPISTLKKVKKRNQLRIDAINKELSEWSAERAKVVLKRTYDLLDFYLDAYGDDVSKISVKDLVLVSRQMFIQTELFNTASQDYLSKQRRDAGKLAERLVR